MAINETPPFPSSRFPVRQWSYDVGGAAGVVHTVAGFFALSALINLGAHIGRFNPEGSVNAIVGRSMPMYGVA